MSKYSCRSNHFVQFLYTLFYLVLLLCLFGEFLLAISLSESQPIAKAAIRWRKRDREEVQFEKDRGEPRATKTPQIFGVGQKICEEIKSVNPRRNFPPFEYFRAFHSQPLRPRLHYFPPFLFISFSATLWFNVCSNNRIPTTKREASSGKRHSRSVLCYIKSFTPIQII